MIGAGRDTQGGTDTGGGPTRGNVCRATGVPLFYYSTVYSFTFNLVFLYGEGGAVFAAPNQLLQYHEGGWEGTIW